MTLLRSRLCAHTRPPQTFSRRETIFSVFILNYLSQRLCALRHRGRGQDVDGDALICVFAGDIDEADDDDIDAEHAIKERPIGI